MTTIEGELGGEGVDVGVQEGEEQAVGDADEPSDAAAAQEEEAGESGVSLCGAGGDFRSIRPGRSVEGCQREC